MNEQALRRCGPGVRQLLSMTEDEILLAKKREDRRIRAKIERLKKFDKRLKKSKKLRARTLSVSQPFWLSPEATRIRDPIIGAVIVGKWGLARVKVRAIVNFGGNLDDLKAMGIDVHSHVHDVFTISATKAQLATLVSQQPLAR